MSKPLEGQVVVVTGASRGLGRAFAIRAAELGADVAPVARTITSTGAYPPGSLGETAAEIESHGVKALPVAADLSRPEDIVRLGREVLDEFGKVDVLVNNAAALITPMWHDFWTLTSEDWDYQIDVNLNSVWHVTKQFAPSMREQGSGRVIHLTSGAWPGRAPMMDPAGQGTAGMGYYVPKAGINQLAFEMAKDFRLYGISCMAMHPGFTKTEANRDQLAEGGLDWEMGHSIEIPVAAFEYLATCPDPLELTGQLVVAHLFVEERGLLVSGARQ
jgi:NAD(P)-dependent dehydrogenase (short-subunit alcohol dehydrogenase family)